MSGQPGQGGRAGGGAAVSRGEFQRVAERVLKLADADSTFLSLSDVEAGTTRFANNQVIQHVQTRRLTLSVTLAFGQRHGTATATDLGDEALRDVVARAARLARLAPPDPEYLPPLPPQTYPPVPTASEETRRADAGRRLQLAAAAIAPCQEAGLTAAGIVTSSSGVAALAASSGLLAYEPRTEARFSLTAIGASGSGWAANVHRSIEGLGVAERTRRAIEKARPASALRELPPGRYTVVLEPAAVAGLVGPLIWSLDAKAYYKRTSALTGKLGSLILDPRVSLSNRAGHPDLVGVGFNSEGVPAEDRVWVERGILRELRYDRYTARQHQVPPSPSLDAPYLSVTGDGEARSAEALVSRVARGLLVTNFWYIRSVNPTDLTLTGMTRDGTFLIEDGRVVAPVVDFRWHDSPLRALREVEGFTAPDDAVSNELWKMKLPALTISAFHFSSVTRV